MFGSAVHSGVQRHFESLLETGHAPELDELLEAFDQCWATFDADLIKFGRGDNAESMRELAAKMFTAFQASDFASPDGTIVAIEESMRGEFVAGMPDVLARVDLAVQDGDDLVHQDTSAGAASWREPSRRRWVR